MVLYNIIMCFLLYYFYNFCKMKIYRIRMMLKLNIKDVFIDKIFVGKELYVFFFRYIMYMNMF